MPSRRKVIKVVAGGVAAAGVLPAWPARAMPGTKIKAIAFDAFPIFDPRPVFALANELFPEKGPELGNTWRLRQFEYTWLRTASRRYADFWQVTEDALVFASRTMKLELAPETRMRLMNAYLELKAWPDVRTGLDRLKEAGVRLAFLSNFTRKMLDAAVDSSGLNGIFECILSTDEVQTYKPDPRAYQMAISALGLDREEILFAPFAGWDAAGAKSFGYPTFWVNRMHFPIEELGVIPDGIGENLTDLANFVGA